MKPRTTFVTVSMPAPLRTQLTKRLERLGVYGSTSDYIRDLIRRDLAREVVDRVDQLLIDGINSGPAEPMDEAWRRARRTALAKHVRVRGRASARS